MTTAVTATVANAWAASLGSIPIPALTIARIAAIRNSLMLNNTGLPFRARPTNSEGDTVATEVLYRDKVRVEFNAEVCSVRDGKAADVDVTIGDDVYHIDNVPVSKMIVTKAATPPQPVVGSMITYYGDKYIRTAAGWSSVRAVNGSMVGSPVAWDTFDHRAVKLMTAGAPLVSR